MQIHVMYRSPFEEVEDDEVLTYCHGERKAVPATVGTR